MGEEAVFNLTTRIEPLAVSSKLKTFESPTHLGDYLNNLEQAQLWSLKLIQPQESAS
jgi:hypothetical protein